jgi:hypothetical protein
MMAGSQNFLSQSFEKVTQPLPHALLPLPQNRLVSLIQSLHLERFKISDVYSQ